MVGAVQPDPGLALCHQQCAAPLSAAAPQHALITFRSTLLHNSYHPLSIKDFNIKSSTP